LGIERTQQLAEPNLDHAACASQLEHTVLRRGRGEIKQV
jgi:hypothetical protein